MIINSSNKKSHNLTFDNTKNTNLIINKKMFQSKNKISNDLYYDGSSIDKLNRIHNIVIQKVNKVLLMVKLIKPLKIHTTKTLNNSDNLNIKQN